LIYKRIFQCDYFLFSSACDSQTNTECNKCTLNTTSFITAADRSLHYNTTNQLRHVCLHTKKQCV